jgi:hypothetical protein
MDVMPYTCLTILTPLKQPLSLGKSVSLNRIVHISKANPSLLLRTGWPEPGGLLPREALKLVGLVAKEGLCGMEVVEVSPPYDHADITSLMALRIVVDALGAMVSHGTMGNHKHIIDKEYVPI